MKNVMAVTNFRKVVSHENLTVTFFNRSKYPLSDIKKKIVIAATSPAKKVLKVINKNTAEIF